jgi:hypothetical protein
VAKTVIIQSLSSHFLLGEGKGKGGERRQKILALMLYSYEQH